MTAIDPTPTTDRPGLLWLLYCLEHPEMIDGYEADPRTPEQRAQDADYADWAQTNESNRP